MTKCKFLMEILKIVSNVSKSVVFNVILIFVGFLIGVKFSVSGIQKLSSYQDMNERVTCIERSLSEQKTICVELKTQIECIKEDLNKLSLKYGE